MNFLNLPPELVLNITDSLPVPDKLNLCATCRRFKAIIRSKLWHHIHLNLSEDSSTSPRDPEIRVIEWKDIKKFYELILGQGFNGPILQAVEKITLTVSDSIYKIPLIKAPTTPSQVSRYPINFLALSLVNSVMPRHCKNIRYVGVYLKEYKTCPRFIFATVGALSQSSKSASSVIEVDVFTLGQQLPIISRQKLSASHLTLLVNEYATIPTFVNRFSVQNVTLDCTQRTVDVDRIKLVLTRLPNLRHVRLKAYSLAQDILRYLPKNVTKVELDVKKVRCALLDCYETVEELVVSDSSDVRLHPSRFPHLTSYNGRLTTSIPKSVTDLKCSAEQLLALMRCSKRDRYLQANVRTLTLKKEGTFSNSELDLVARFLNLEELVCICSGGVTEVFKTVLFGSASLKSVCVYCPTLVPCMKVYTGKVLKVTDNKHVLERYLGYTNDTAYTDSFRPSWQPKEKTKRSSRVLS